MYYYQVFYSSFYGCVLLRHFTYVSKLCDLILEKLESHCRPIMGRSKRSDFFIRNVPISGSVITDLVIANVCYVDFRAFFSCVFVFAICSL